MTYVLARGGPVPIRSSQDAGLQRRPRVCVKSLRSSYTGLCPQTLLTPVILHGVVGSLNIEIKTRERPCRPASAQGESHPPHKTVNLISQLAMVNNKLTIVGEFTF